MGKTYFNLADDLSFNGKELKIKANATGPVEKLERNGRAYFPANAKEQIYQSVLDTLPQLCSAESNVNMPIDAVLRFLNSSAKAGKINIQGTKGGGYIVTTNTSLAKATTGARNTGSANISYASASYFVIAKRGNIYIRKEPKGGTKVLKTVVPSELVDAVTVNGSIKTRRDENGDLWLWVYTDASKTISNAGWIFKNYVYKNEKIVTRFPESTYKSVTGQHDGKKIEVFPLTEWWTFGGRQTGVYRDSQDRYIVAVGPKILWPDYPDDGAVDTAEFNGFSRYIEVVIKHETTGVEKTLKCYATDLKAHSFTKFPYAIRPEVTSTNAKSAEYYGIKNGIMQTGIRYPNAGNGGIVMPINFDGSIVEFYGTSLDFTPSNYKIIKITANLQRTDFKQVE